MHVLRTVPTGYCIIGTYEIVNMIKLTAAGVNRLISQNDKIIMPIVTIHLRQLNYQV